MAMFELVATAELTVLLCVILYGNAFRAIPASPANSACGPDLHQRVVLAHHCLVLTAFAAATLLLAVKTGVRALAAARPVAKGIGSVAAGWKRRSLRGTLLLAVALSFAASVLADVTFEDGFLYRTGCHAGYGAGAPLGLLVIGLFALLHGFFAWAAVTQN